MKIVFTGGRDYDDYDKVSWFLYTLDRENNYQIEMVVGDARGFDRCVREYCGYSLDHPNVFRADWKTHGRRAGPIRNYEMLDTTKPDLVIAFPGGRGTADCVRQARKLGIPVREVQ